MNKLCSKCKRVKSSSAFNKDKSTYDGLYSSCKVCRKGVSRKGYLTSRTKILSTTSTYRRKNKTRILAQRKDWRARNRQLHNWRAIKWRIEHPEEARNQSAKKRARKYLQWVEDVDRRIVYNRDKGICYLCGLPVDPKNWHQDHKIPLSKGGPHSYANVAVTHPRCNLEKGIKVAA